MIEIIVFKSKDISRLVVDTIKDQKNAFGLLNSQAEINEINYWNSCMSSHLIESGNGGR